MIEPFLECMPWPPGTPITQEFGDTFSGYAHRGRDAGCPVGTPLMPGASGVVVPCTNDGSFGNAVCVRYDDSGLYGLLAHNSELLVSIGQRVRARQVVAKSGYSGYVQPPGPAGAHSHFQVCIDSRFSTNIADSFDPRALMIPEAEMARIDRLERIVIANGFQAVCRPGTEDLFPAGTPVTPEGQDGPRYLLTGEAALAYADRRGFSLALAIEANTDADIARAGGAR